MPGRNHFSVLESLADPDPQPAGAPLPALSRAILGQIFQETAKTHR